LAFCIDIAAGHARSDRALCTRAVVGGGASRGGLERLRVGRVTDEARRAVDDLNGVNDHDEHHNVCPAAIDDLDLDA